MVHDYSRLFEHMFWADTRILEMLEAQPDACTDEVLRTFSHILGSERVWLLRLTGGDSGVQPVWPELSLPRLHDLAASNAEGYGQFLAGLGEGDDGVDMVYSNSEGVPFRNAIGDILLHVALHGSYHRGQVARAVRNAGFEPVKTDFIAFARLDGN